MITIKNKELNNTKVVTRGAYDNFYESLGYEIVKNEVKQVERKVENNKNTNKDEDKGEHEKFSRKQV